MRTIYFYLYQLILILCIPLAIIYLLKEAHKRQGGAQFFSQRLGFGYGSKNEFDIWLHAASLGEVNALKPLISQLCNENPSWQVLITTNTTTGEKAVRKLRNKQITHYYLPLDLPWMVSHFLRQARSKRFIVMETEMWPNLYTQAAALNLAPTLVNGRLSDKTLSHTLLYPLFGYCLKKCQWIYTRSQNDYDNFVTLGAPKERMLIVGNIKFSAAETQIQELDSPLKFSYALAASTHDNEEQQICEAILNTDNRPLLVIIPRHIERRDQILDRLSEFELNIAVRSLGDQVTEETDIYLADTIGEMIAFIAHANWVFMGGSLVQHGGQNMLEPAQLGKAIICGPHTFNFIDEISALIAVNGVLIAENQEELQQHIQDLQNDDNHCETIGQNATHLIKNNAGISRHYARLLKNQWHIH